MMIVQRLMQPLLASFRQSRYSGTALQVPTEQSFPR